MNFYILYSFTPTTLMKIIKPICTVLLSLLVLRAGAQYDPAKIDKKAVQLFDQSMMEGRERNLKAGVELLKKAVAVDNHYADAYLSMAGMYTELKNYQAAVDNYKIARSIDSIYFKDYSLSYSIPLAGLGKFEAALAAVNDFKSIPTLHESSLRAADYRIRSYQFAIDYAAKKINRDYKFDPHNMGDSINSSVSEYFPTISLDGKH
ncbi:MAG TPA: hypothetical protein VGH64_11320, partial [Puia sp.]